MTQDSALPTRNSGSPESGREARTSKLATQPWLVLASSLLVAAAVLVLDQITKAWILATIPVNESVNVVGSFFRLSHARNTGVAFGLMRDQPFVPFMTAAVALGLVVLFVWRLHLHTWPVRVVFGMIIGGAIGNLIDRQVYGSVTDFLDFGIDGLRWPAFNVADASIVCGVISLAIYLWFQGDKG